MPIVNDTSNTHLKNTTMAAHAHEVRAVATVGTGREVMLGAGANASMPAATFESRITPAETGTH